jgi:galactokinase/galacturonokinase
MLQSFPLVSEQAAEARAILLSTFSVDPAAVQQLFMPYRICPLGAHIDHQGGHVLGRIINTGTVLVYAPLPEPEIHLESVNFPGPFSFDIGAAVQPDHWARYAQAAAKALDQKYTLERGFAGVTSGTLIGAGLSSSAAVGLAYLQALANVNDIHLTAADLVELDYQLEHAQLGLQNGILDQSSILFGRPNTLVYIDTRRRQTRLIPDPPQTGEVGWLIVHSGIVRELTKSGGYNQSVAECHAAARWLSREAEVLSDVSCEQFVDRAASMPENLRRRATHYFNEVARVASGVQAWEACDVTRFGALMNDSCASSINEYGSGQEEVIALHRIISNTAGVYGSRFSGAGYGGVVIGLVDRAQAETAASSIMQQYSRLFPGLAERAVVYLVENGVALWPEDR